MNNHRNFNQSPNQQRLNKQWQTLLGDEFAQPYMQQLWQFLQSQQAAIYPPEKDIFAAFDCTPIEQLKVVILGQDPYHAAGQAHGLSFSVPKGVAIPPSLRNIYKELASDCALPIPQHGNLTQWGQQGVLLLNSVLSVQHARPASHQGKGWERFTDQVINVINHHTQHVVFMLWGAYAQNKGRIVDRNRHRVLQAPHPSPLSAHRGFFNCRHFSQANQYLIEQGKTPIDWRIR